MGKFKVARKFSMKRKRGARLIHISFKRVIGREKVFLNYIDKWRFLHTGPLGFDAK